MSSRAYDKVVEKNGHKYIQLGSGRLTTFWDNTTAAERAFTEMTRHFSRAFKIADPDLDMESLEYRVDRLEEYVSALRNEIEKRRTARSVRERIAQLRNTSGRTAEEAALYRQKADELERQLEAAS